MRVFGYTPLPQFQVSHYSPHLGNIFVSRDHQSCFSLIEGQPLLSLYRTLDTGFFNHRFYSNAVDPNVAHKKNEEERNKRSPAQIPMQIEVPASPQQPYYDDKHKDDSGDSEEGDWEDKITVIFEV